MTFQPRNSTLCPNCGKLISLDEPQCPYCGISRPGSWWKSHVWTSALRSPEQLIKVIIYVNAGMFILSLLLNPLATGMSLNPLSFLSPDGRSLLLLGASGTIPIDQFGRWWTLVSASYLHGGILHIVFNMIALKQIGPLIVQEYGGSRMFIIYTLAGVLGYLASYLAGVPFTIGASASVCGLLGAALYYGKSRGGVYGQAVYKQISGWVISIFIFGLLVPGINDWAHGGGIAAGIILGLVLGYEERRAENLLHKTAAGVCALLTLAVLVWAVGFAIFFRLQVR